MATTLQDLKYAIRSLARAPGFAAVAVLTLALGIGAATAVLTVVHAVVVRPLPYPQADRLVMLWQDLSAGGGPVDEWASPGNFVDWRTALSGVDGVAAIGGWQPTLTGDAAPEGVAGEQVSHEYLGVLGARPALGRDFAPADDIPNARRVALLGDALWRRRFGADPAVVGRTVTLAGEPHEIVGVLSPGFRPVVAAEAQVWRPLRLNRAAPVRGAVVLRVVGRLAPGVSTAQAQEAATALARRLEVEHAEFNAGVGFFVEPLAARVSGRIQPALLALAGAVGLVLLIACANVANLVMARAAGRGRELATRAALGAGRARVVRQLVTEGLVLAGAGGIAGLLLGVWGVDALVALAPPDAPRLDEVRLDYVVVAVAMLLTLASSVLVGAAPALLHARADLGAALKEGGRGTAGPGGGGLRRLFVGAQIALALVLVTGSVLLAETFARLQAADLGFRPDNVLTGAIVPARAAYDTPAKLVALYDQVLERAAALPGVERAALTSVLPLDDGDSDMSFAIEGQPPPARREDALATWYRLISAGYFETMGMPVVRGRGFAAGEAAPAVVVNETFARRHFPGQDPIGQRLRFGSAARPPFVVVGVVADARGHGARADLRVEAFLPYWQFTEPGMSVVLRGPAPEGFAAPLARAVAAIDGQLPVIDVRTLAARLGASISVPRFLAWLAGAFAVLALLLAAIGTYSVMAFDVAQRRSEIGVRLALGARAPEVFRLVVGDGMRLAAAGLAVGLGGALLAARALAAQLFGVDPADPIRLAATLLLLVTLVVIASVVPAWRAMRVDPATVLRAD
jgi:putative ABC transport system permease protein